MIFNVARLDLFKPTHSVMLMVSSSNSRLCLRLLLSLPLLLCFQLMTYFILMYERFFTLKKCPDQSFDIKSIKRHISEAEWGSSRMDHGSASHHSPIGGGPGNHEPCSRVSQSWANFAQLVVREMQINVELLEE